MILKLQGAGEQLNLLLFLAVIWQVKMSVMELRVSDELLCIVKLLIIICSRFFFVCLFFLFHGINLTASELLGLWVSLEEIF